MMKEHKQKIAIVLSFILHGLLSVALLYGDRFAPARRPRLTEVELLDPDQLLAQLQAAKRDDRSKGQVVDQDEKALNDERDENAKFLSRHDQKVVRETQAAHHGRFRNTDGSSGEKTPQKISGRTPERKSPITADARPTEKRHEKQTRVLRSKDGIAARTRPEIKDLLPSFKPGPPPTESEQLARGGGEGPSVTDDHLKNVKTGLQTLLSTREFVYYSYYNRIKDKLRQYWEPKIKEKMTNLLRQGRTIASNTERITRIVIVLDNNGTLIKVQIIGPSGVSDLDDAAAEAFRAAAPFPNPPKGIVDADGTIKIRWDFILEA